MRAFLASRQRVEAVAAIFFLALTFPSAVQSAAAPAPSGAERPHVIVVDGAREETKTKAGEINNRQNPGVIHNPKPDGADDRLATYTFWLMIFTAVLAVASIFQGCLIVRQLRLARAEFNATHRPRFVIRDVYLDQIDGRHCACFTVVNIGDAPGKLVESARLVGIHYFDRTFITSRPGGRNEMGALKLAPGEMRELFCPAPSLIPEAMRTTTQSGAIGFPYFAGAMIYRGPDGRLRRTIFRRRYDMTEARFVLDPSDAEYDYTD